MNEERASVPIDNETSLDKAVPSKSIYLSKEDVDPPILVQIAYMTTDDIEVEGHIEQRAVLHFNGDVKPMIVNNTNKELLKAITGAQTVGELRNHQIVLYHDPAVMYGKKAVGGIRVRAAQNQPTAQPVSHVPGPAPAPGPAPGSASDQDFDDSIPY